MACTKQTVCKTKPTQGMATYQGGTVSSSSEELEESTLSETHGETAPTQERESSKQTELVRASRKRKRGDRTASSSLQSADSTRRSRKAQIEYSTDETDKDKIPAMQDEGYEFPRKTK